MFFPAGVQPSDSASAAFYFLHSCAADTTGNDCKDKQRSGTQSVTSSSSSSSSVASCLLGLMWSAAVFTGLNN